MPVLSSEAVYSVPLFEKLRDEEEDCVFFSLLPLWRGMIFFVSFPFWWRGLHRSDESSSHPLDDYPVSHGS